MLILKNSFFYLTTIACLVVDVCCFSLYEQQFLYPLLCFYLITLLQLHTPIAHIALLIALIILQYFMYYGLFLPPLLYLIPVTLIGLCGKRFLYTTTLPAYVLLIASLLANCLLIEPYFFGTQPTAGYTVFTLFANVIVMMLFSLK